MTRVDFYVFADQNLRQHDLFICRLTDKAWRQGHRIHIHCRDSARAESIDELLWTFTDTSFVPHARCHDAAAGSAPVIIGFGDETPLESNLLVNLDTDVPAYFSQFDRVVETTGIDETARQGARIRYRFYKQRGYDLTTHNIDSGND